MSALTIIEQRGHIDRAGATDWTLGVAGRLIVASKAVWFYAAKLVWPVSLTFVYPRWEVPAELFSSWLPLAGLIAAGLVLWVWRKQYWARAVLLGTGFFVAALLPVLGFFDIFYFQYSFVADHFQYLACVGLISLAANTGMAICERAGQRGRDLGTLAATIVLLIFGVSTWRQTHIYQDSEALWRDTLHKNSNAWMAHNNLGLTLQNSGRETEAIEQYEQSLRVNPKNADAHNNWGTVLMREGKISDAIGHYEEALRIKPDYAEAYNNLGAALDQAGKFAGAIESYEQALRIKPDNAQAHYNLGIALQETGRLRKAIEHYQQALRITPDYEGAHYNLGIALQQTGQLREAVEHYEQALRIKPDNADAHNNLGLALARLGRVQEAMGHWEQALQIKPDDTGAHYNLGLALVQ